MKQALILSVTSIALLLLTAAASTGQEKTSKAKRKYTSFEEGSRSLGFSVGTGINYNYYGNVTALPAFAVTWDKGIIGDVGPGTIGLGGIVGFKTAYYEYGNDYRASWNNYIVALRGTYHIAVRSGKFDPYVGLMAGVRFIDYHDNYYSSSIINPYNYSSVYRVTGLFVGAKYNLSPRTGIFAELGYDISLFRVGICFNN